MHLSSLLQTSFHSLSAINFFIWNADSTSQVDDYNCFLIGVAYKVLFRGEKKKNARVGNGTGNVG